jgi:hypothetical protein
MKLIYLLDQPDIGVDLINQKVKKSFFKFQLGFKLKQKY